MPRQQPHVIGVTREQKSTRMHNEVIRNLQDIADREDKSFAWVVSEIVYQYFGLKVTDDIVEIIRARRKAKARKGRRPANRRNDGRMDIENILRFEKRRNAKRIA